GSDLGPQPFPPNIFPAGERLSRATNCSELKVLLYVSAALAVRSALTRRSAHNKDAMGATMNPKGEHHGHHRHLYHL
ncbi:MAG: hypothetical protein ACRERD_29690, partial [Candidatus Binatia bacterium]